jgi:hypothetical protein
MKNYLLVLLLGWEFYIANNGALGNINNKINKIQQLYGTCKSWSHK